MTTDITVWGRLSSANVQKVIWTLEELELPYAQIDLGGKFKGNDAPDYLALNPNGLVPTLRDGDLVIWESHAIVRYLSAEYASGLLWPIEPRTRAIVDQWTDWAATQFQPAWLGLFWNAVRTPVGQQDSTAIEKSLAAAFRQFGILDRRLAQVPFVGGEQLTYADIVIGASMHRWMGMDIDRPDLPHVEAWNERLLARTAFRKAICVSYAELIGRTSF